MGEEEAGNVTGDVLGIRKKEIQVGSQSELCKQSTVTQKRLLERVLVGP